MAIDGFDVLALLVDGPHWLHQLDLLVAIAATGAVGGVDAYFRRYG